MGFEQGIVQGEIVNTDDLQNDWEVDLESGGMDGKQVS